MRHIVFFQQIPPVTLALPSRLNNQDAYLYGTTINRARSSSGLYQASNNVMGSIGDSNNRRESSMSNDSGYFIADSRRTSDVDYFSNLGGLGCNPTLLLPASPTDWSHQQPPITLHNYNGRKLQEHVQGPGPADYNSSSISDFLPMQEPTARRDSGMSTNSESSRRSSFFSASPVPPTSMYGTNNLQNKIAVPVSGVCNQSNQNVLGIGSTSSGCSESSTDSLLEQDLQNLAVSVSQKGLE